MSIDTQVAIVGAGPVGMTLALDLAARGINVTVVERRSPGEPPSAKCNTVSSRTMEIFRRLGIAHAVREVGLTDDYPTDVTYCTSLFGDEMTRIVLPSRRARFGPDGRSAPGYPDSAWPTPEPVHRVSQIYLEPVLFDALRRQSLIRVINDAECVRYVDHGDQVLIDCRHLDGSGEFRIAARYLVGCDGARSTIRKQMGVSLIGDAQLARTRSTLIRSRDMLKRFRGKPVWMAWIVNPRVTGTVVAIDGDALWLVHRSLQASAPDFESLDPDASLRAVLGVGGDFTYKTVHHEDWTGRRLVAAQFRQGNVFIAGDAAHLWIPYAGYGMNAGIADATNLSWMLAAVLNGWAPEGLLDAHETERHPITEQVSKFAMNLLLANAARSSRRKIPRALTWPNFVGRMLRRRLGASLRELNLPQFICEGLNFGYYYDRSPIIAYDGEQAPDYTMGSATPSTVPGCRMPHFWLPDGTSVYDRLGLDYTLVRFDGHIDVRGLVESAKQCGVPLTLLDVARPKHDAYRHDLLLVRPDQQVAWRGDLQPVDCHALIEQIRGGHVQQAQQIKPGISTTSMSTESNER